MAPRDSFNNEVGLPLTVLKLEADTKYLVLELGAAGPGSIEKLASWTKPDYGIELKVGLAHAGAGGAGHPDGLGQGAFRDPLSLAFHLVVEVDASFAASLVFSGGEAVDGGVSVLGVLSVLAGERGAEPSRWLAGLHVGSPAESGTALRLWSGPGGCATRPAGSDMLAIPLPKARGKPGPACVPATPTQAPRQPPTRLFCPAGATPRSRARGTPPAGRKGLG